MPGDILRTLYSTSRGKVFCLFLLFVCVCLRFTRYRET